MEDDEEEEDEKHRIANQLFDEEEALPDLDRVRVRQNSCEKERVTVLVAGSERRTREVQVSFSFGGV